MTFKTRVPVFREPHFCFRRVGLGPPGFPGDLGRAGGGGGGPHHEHAEGPPVGALRVPPPVHHLGRHVLDRAAEGVRPLVVVHGLLAEPEIWGRDSPQPSQSQGARPGASGAAVGVPTGWSRRGGFRKAGPACGPWASAPGPLQTPGPEREGGTRVFLWVTLCVAVWDGTERKVTQTGAVGLEGRLPFD